MVETVQSRPQHRVEGVEVERGVLHSPAAAPVRAALGEALWQQATPIRARKGRTIVSLGAESSTVYVLLEGRAQATLFSLSGREVVLRTIGAGEMFGELAVILGEPRTATIVAHEDCLLAAIPGAAFRDGVAGRPEAALWMLRRLAAQVRSLTEKVFELNALRVPTRLHCELLRLAGPVAEDGLRAEIAPAPTHAELAARIGTHRESVTRELGELTEMGIIAQRGRQLTITDLPALARLVHSASGSLYGEPE